MNVLITGITGMIGSSFAKSYEEMGWDVFGIARSSAASRIAAIQDPRVINCDILDGQALDDLIKKIKPDVVIHLAAQAFNGLSWKMEEITHLTNYFGTLNLLKACKKNIPEAQILYASSSATYGNFNASDCPLKEERALKPITPYGVSKAGGEQLAYQYFINYKMKIYLPRLFIHVGTGHPPATAIQNFARQLALIKKGKAEPTLKVGNLETARDFIDVRDGVSGMMLLLEKGKTGEPINICTGKAHKIKDILDILIKTANVSDIKIEKDIDLLRPSDEQLLLGDNSKLVSLGWSQKYTIEQTLESVFNDWLERI